MPSNLPAILIQVDPTIWDADEDTLSIERVDGAEPELIAGQFAYDEEDASWISGQTYMDILFTPDVPFVEGAVYRVSLVNFPEDTVEFSVGPAAPFPTSLGAATQTGVEEGPVPTEGELSCPTSRMAPFAQLELEFDAAALPWAEAMAWETLREDRDQRLGDYCEVHDVAHRVEDVFAECLSGSNTSVVFRGTIPGRAPLATNALEVPCERGPESPAGSKGCSVHRTADAGGLALVLLPLAAVLAIRRRRA